VRSKKQTRHISVTTKKELIAASAKRCLLGSREEKSRILDQFVAISGMHRKHAMRLLRRSDKHSRYEHVLATTHPKQSNSPLRSIVAGLLDIPENNGKAANGRLTQAQMNKLLSRLDARSDCRLTLAEMAATVGLSESWSPPPSSRQRARRRCNGSLQSASILRKSCWRKVIFP
jgi:hypothetical protein